jgi:cyclopropane fatty-acyl-phospholipid synthase-like methyltransferase
MEADVMSEGDAYRTYLSTMLDEREQNFHNALHCLRIVRDLVSFNHVVDFGCGIGAWMAAATWLGASKVIGVDGPWSGDVMTDDKITFHGGDVSVTRSQILSVDMASEDPPNLMKTFDLAMSIEVAEHLPETRAEIFCQALVDAADYVLFSAATPGQGGFLHINEQPLEYWVAKFWARGYVPLDVVRPAIYGCAWIYPYIRRNIVMFVEFNAMLRNERLLRFAQSSAQISRPWVA